MTPHPYQGYCGDTLHTVLYGHLDIKPSELCVCVCVCACVCVYAECTRPPSQSAPLCVVISREAYDYGTYLSAVTGKWRLWSRFMMRGPHLNIAVTLCKRWTPSCGWLLGRHVRATFGGSKAVSSWFVFPFKAALAKRTTLKRPGRIKTRAVITTEASAGCDSAALRRRCGSKEGCALALPRCD